jgi:hypothetical protein
MNAHSDPIDNRIISILCRICKKETIAFYPGNRMAILVERNVLSYYYLVIQENRSFPLFFLNTNGDYSLAVKNGNDRDGKIHCRLHCEIEQISGTEDFSCSMISKNMSVNSLLSTFNSSTIYAYNYNNSGAFLAHHNENVFYFTSRNYNNLKENIGELFMDCDQCIHRHALLILLEKDSSMK